MRSGWLVAVAMLLAAGCALRPRYGDVVPVKSAAKEVRLQVVDKDSGEPVPGAKIEFGDRNRFKATADDKGFFTVPVDGKFAEENALLVVSLPRGVGSYRLVPDSEHAAVPVVPPGDEAPADAGVTSL